VAAAAAAAECTALNLMAAFVAGLWHSAAGNSTTTTMESQDEGKLKHVFC
jgi:hypothetical protein